VDETREQPPTTSGSDWYLDPAVLAAEVKHARPVGAPPPMIAGYDGLREVARGGQGVVYRGTQRSTRRPVAIKVLLDSSLASGAARRRFEREIDLVAGLRHPSIVSVYDSGATADGRLYLVMEFIDGVALDDAARGHPGEREPMSVRGTLDLFRRVCEAVQYAHQRGVIHRDLKPSNIRVDIAGEPHILDFGLAKLAARPDEAGRSALSTSGQFMGSLPWASPEQASGDPERIDTRSDVYSLGVILYQLLTGVFPYDVGSGLKATIDNILTAEPSRASRLRHDADDEVSTIVAKCLDKSPDRRYQSAGELARDICHYLNGEPIQAKRDSAWYTLRKNLRRYRLVAGATAAVAVAVSVGLVVSVLFWQRADHDRAIALAQFDRAEAINGFLVEMLSAADPDKDGKEVRVVDLLDRAAGTVDARFSRHGETRASVRMALSRLYSKLGQSAAAELQAREALKILVGEGRGESREGLAAESEAWSIAHKQGRTAEALPALERVLERQRAILGPNDPDTLATQGDLGQCLLATGKTDEALAMFQGAADAWRVAAGRDDPRALTLQTRIASVLADQGKLAEAEVILRDTLERQRRVMGPENSETMVALGNLGVLLIDLGRLEEAYPLQREGLDIEVRKLGPEHPVTLSAMNNLAKLLQDLGRLDEADVMMKQTLDARIKVLGEEHPHTLVTMSNYGVLLSKRGHKEESAQVARRVLDIRLRTLGEENLGTIISLNNLGGAINDLGRPEEAEQWYRRAVAAAERSLAPDHWLNALFRANLANCLIGLKRYDEAEEILLPAAARLLEALGPEHAHTIKARANLVKLYEAWGRPEKAAGFRAAAPAPAR